MPEDQSDFPLTLDIALHPVKSTNILSIGYCPMRSIIAVEFASGAMYHYIDCEQSLFDDFLASESKGQFFHRCVKTKKCVKVAQE